MTQADAQTAKTLNTLLESAHDSADGFRQAASLARNPSFQSLFSMRAEERQVLASEIEVEVRAFGGDPVCDGTMLGDAHRVFTKVRDLIAHGSDRAIVAELVRGEGLVERRFEAAVSEGQLPPKARELAERAAAKIKHDQDEIAGLGEQFR